MKNHLTSAEILKLATTHQDHGHLHICSFCKEQYDDAIDIEETNSSGRKLASVQEILDLKPIKNADRIEVATILGWRVVVRKGEFQVGDKCIFFEIDSILPQLPEFEFLAEHQYRLKSAQLRGQISQGLAMPLDVINKFPNLRVVPKYVNDSQDKDRLVPSGNFYICTDDFGHNQSIFKHTQLDFESAGYCVEMEIGTDLTKVLGIEKYVEETKELEKGILGKPFPSEHVHHTDLERIQSKPELFEEIRGLDAYALQKIDGYSFTAILKITSDRTADLLICSSDQELERMDGFTTSNEYLDIASKLNIRSKMDFLAANMAMKFYEEGNNECLLSLSIQCELAGPGIRKNRMGLQEKQLFLFNGAYITDNMHYMDYAGLSWASQILDIPMPQLVWDGVFDFKSPDELMDLADANRYPSGFRQEGIVIKPKKETYSETLCGRLQFKVINNNYLLDIGE